MELGTIGSVAHGAPILRTPYSAISQIKIADDDAAVAVIRHSHRAEFLNRQNSGNADSTIATLAERIKDFCKFTEQKLEKHGQLAQEIAKGHFSANSLRSLATLQTPASAQALQVQANLEPSRALHLLKDVPKTPAERSMQMSS